MCFLPPHLPVLCCLSSLQLESICVLYKKKNARQVHTDEQGMKAGRQEDLVKHRQNVRVLVSIICLIKSLHIYWEKNLESIKNTQ